MGWQGTYRSEDEQSARLQAADIKKSEPERGDMVAELSSGLQSAILDI